MDRRRDVVVPLRSDEVERLRLEAEVLDDLEAADGPDLRGLRPSGLRLADGSARHWF